MIVKLIAPGIIRGDYVTADLQAVPHRGDTVLVETPNADGGHDEELLTVKSVVWSIEIVPGRSHHAVTGADGGLPEVVCERTEDAAATGLCILNEAVQRASRDARAATMNTSMTATERI